MDYSFYLIADCFAGGSYPSLCMGSFGFSYYLSFDTYALLREVSNPTIRAITDHYILVEAFLLLSYFALFWFYYKRNNRYKAIFEHYSQKRAQYIQVAQRNVSFFDFVSGFIIARSNYGVDKTIVVSTGEICGKWVEKGPEHTLY